MIAVNIEVEISRQDMIIKGMKKTKIETYIDGLLGFVQSLKISESMIEFRNNLLKTIKDEYQFIVDLEEWLGPYKTETLDERYNGSQDNIFQIQDEEPSCFIEKYILRVRPFYVVSHPADGIEVVIQKRKYEEARSNMKGLISKLDSHLILDPDNGTLSFV